MKQHLFAISAVLILGQSGSALADCAPNTRVNGSALTSAISGKTICAAKGSDRWQEYHNPNQDLVDWKMGPPASGNIDPTEKVGTWNIAANTLTHTYGTSSYSYEVHLVGTSYSLCGVGGAPNFDSITIIAGQVPCP